MKKITRVIIATLVTSIILFMLFGVAKFMQTYPTTIICILLGIVLFALIRIVYGVMYED